jgi:hypothetical protein
MICDNCEIVENLSTLYPIEGHRCRADENSCSDGKECPDYIKSCDCTCNKKQQSQSLLELQFLDKMKGANYPEGWQEVGN